MKSLILFLKGFIIGLGKIIPGVSGSVLAISLGVYEEALNKMEHIFHHFKENMLYFIPLGLGIGLSVLLGSNVILYCLNHFYVYTMVLFIGLIIGTIPSMIKKQKFHSKDWFMISVVFLILYFFYNSISLPEFNPQSNIFTYLYITFLGFLDAATTIMPGISGTATYMALGSYNFVLNLFSNPFSQIGYAILFAIGLIFGLFFMIKFVNFCFRKYAHQTWTLILAFLFSSVYFLVLKTIDSINSSNIFSVICLLIFSYFLVNSLEE